MVKLMKNQGLAKNQIVKKNQKGKKSQRVNKNKRIKEIMNWVEENKTKVVIIISVIVIAHTILITKGITNYYYERLRDLGVTTVGIAFGWYYSIKTIQTKNKNWIYTMFIAATMTAVAVIHLLRLIYGGLQC